MKRFLDLLADCLSDVEEVFPWDLEEMLAKSPPPLLLDVREPAEFEAMHIAGSLSVPRGIVESACEYGYEETVPTLVEARDQEIVVICRSGYRSVLAAHSLQMLGYKQVFSLKTGLRGWNDYEQPLVDGSDRAVPIEEADDFFTVKLRPEQLGPSGVAKSG